MKTGCYYNLTVYRFGSLGHGNEIFTADFQKAASARLTAVSLAHAIMDRKIGLMKDNMNFDIIPEGLGNDESMLRVEGRENHDVPLKYKFIVTQRTIHKEFIDADEIKNQVGLA